MGNYLTDRVLRGEVLPHALVRMSADEMASPELVAKRAEWIKNGAYLDFVFPVLQAQSALTLVNVLLVSGCDERSQHLITVRNSSKLYKCDDCGLRSCETWMVRAVVYFYNRAFHAELL